jgi:hypothetical protein
MSGVVLLPPPSVPPSLAVCLGMVRCNGPLDGVEVVTNRVRPAGACRTTRRNRIYECVVGSGFRGTWFPVTGSCAMPLACPHSREDSYDTHACRSSSLSVVGRCRNLSRRGRSRDGAVVEASPRQ